MNKCLIEFDDLMEQLPVNNLEEHQRSALFNMFQAGWISGVCSMASSSAATSELVKIARGEIAEIENAFIRQRLAQSLSE